MIQGYKNVAVIYGGSGRKYAELFNKKLNETSEIERYPICARIINERILTRELLNDVMKLFKKSEFCVAFLTKEDCCLNENNKKYRLRQNVVFELGMALIELGRERVILLSDFDVKETDFDLPSDMSSLEILKFCHGNLENVLNDVIEKLLKLSQISVFTEEKSDTVPKYDYLLTRTNYRIDYENIFSEHPPTLLLEGEQFFTNTLEDWADECKNLKHYDEKCIYLLERIGLLPVFGKTPEAIQFMEKAEEIVESYKESDINYYGDSKILDFTNNLVLSYF